MTSKDRLDSLLAEWPSVDGASTDVQWDERAASIVTAATSAKQPKSAALSDDALFAAPLAGLPEEGVLGMPTQTSATGASATGTGRLPQGTKEVVEKKMGNPSDRNRDRTSFQDLAKMAATPPPPTTSMNPTPAPAAVSSGAVRGTEASKDDSGIVDLKAMATADPGAVERSQSTPLATAGLFDDDVAPKAAGSSGLAAAVGAPSSSGALAPATLAASTSTNAPEPVAAVAAPVAKPEQKKKGGGLLLLLGGFGAVAAIAAGVFFFVIRHKVPATVANNNPVVAAQPATPTTSTAVAPAASIAMVDDTTTPDLVDNTPGKAIPKFNGYKPGVKPGPNTNPGAAPSSSVDPKLTFVMPQTSPGSGGDLDEEMRQRVDGKKGSTLTPASTPTAAGNVPQKPSQGQVAGAINVVLPAARACVNADDPISKATVVFQSDGSVQSVTVTGFASGKGAEGCIKTALTKAKVPAFAEPSYAFPVTVRGTN